MLVIGFMLNQPHFIPHAQTLIHSIRINGGFLSAAPIFVLHPPTLTPPNLSDTNTTFLSFQTPQNLQSIPFADKISAAQTFEQHLNQIPEVTEFLWVDIDSLILQPPIALKKLSSKINIAYRTVDKRNIGIPSTQKLDSFWQSILSHFDYHPPVLLHYTTVSHEKIHPYINAGFIYARNSNNVFAKTLEAMQILIEDPQIQSQLNASPLHSIFFHQAILTIAILKNFPTQQRAHLADTLNYPLHFHHQLHQDLTQIQTLRYDTYFDDFPTTQVPKIIKSCLPVECQKLTSFWPYT